MVAAAAAAIANVDLLSIGLKATFTIGLQAFWTTGAKVPHQFRSRVRKFQGTKVPGNESSTYGTFAPGSESTRERKLQLPYGR